MLPILITARSVAGRLSRRLGGGRRRAVSHLDSRRGEHTLRYAYGQGSHLPASSQGFALPLNITA